MKKKLILGVVIMLAALSIKAQTFVIQTDSSFQQKGETRSEIVFYPATWTFDVNKGTVHLKTKDLNKTYPITASKAVNDITFIFTIDMGNSRTAMILVCANPKTVIMGDSNVQFHFRIKSVEQFDSINF